MLSQNEWFRAVQNVYSESQCMTASLDVTEIASGENEFRATIMGKNESLEPFDRGFGEFEEL